MGLRATSIKKYEIVYGDNSGFNYDPDTLSNIIEDYCEDFYNGEDLPDTNVVWEVDKTQFRNMVSELEKMSDEEFKSKMEDWKYGCECYNKNYVVTLFKGFLSDTPEDSNYVRIAWL